MSNFCIVCEFNPLHNGHEYLLREARRLGADSIVCVMSGNSTQRGELAITDKYSRAEAAIKCGADLVLELPFPWSSASGEYFATAAVSIASHICDKLIFGSECGDIEQLQRAAMLCEQEGFKDEYAKRAAAGEGAAIAFAELLREKGVKNLSSNDLLGISYIRAINRLGVDITPITVKRQGAEYNCTEICGEEFQSATAIREEILNGEPIEEYIPKVMLEILEQDIKHGRITDTSELDGAILGYFRLSNASDFEGIADTEGGIVNRIIAAASSQTSYSQMFDEIKTKRYTDAKLRRAILFCITGVRSDTLKTLPVYTNLLGVNERGRELLASKRRCEGLDIVTKPANMPDCIQTELTKKLDSLYGIARKSKLPSDFFIKKSAYIEK